MADVGDNPYCMTCGHPKDWHREDGSCRYGDPGDSMASLGGARCECSRRVVDASVASTLEHCRRTCARIAVTSMPTPRDVRMLADALEVLIAHVLRPNE